MRESLRLPVIFTLLLLSVVSPLSAQATTHWWQRVMRTFEQLNKSTVEIIDSGSTNAAGYIIWVSRDGEVRYSILSKRNRSADLQTEARKLPGRLTARLFSDVASALPLNGHKTPADCMKSASFGTTLRVKYSGQMSPDISCEGSDPQLKAIYADTLSIVKALEITPKLRLR